MAMTRVQGTGTVTASGAGSLALTFATVPTVGNAAIVLVHQWSASAFPLGGCVDNRGNTYTLAVTTTGTANTAGIYYCAKITTAAAPFTITVTAAAAYYVGAAVEVGGLSSLGLGTPRTASATGSSAAIATGATAALTASEVVIAAVGSPAANQASITVESVTPAWTQEYEYLNQSAIVAGEGDTRLRTGVAGTTQSCSWTIATSAQWAAVIAAFADGGASAAVARADTFFLGPV